MALKKSRKRSGFVIYSAFFKESTFPAVPFVNVFINFRTERGDRFSWKKCLLALNLIRLAGPPFCEGRVALLAKPTFLPAGSTRSGPPSYPASSFPLTSGRETRQASMRSKGRRLEVSPAKNVYACSAKNGT